MNLPNKITISRVLLIPFFMIFLFSPMDLGDITLFSTTLPLSQFIAAMIFIFASCTDWVDGYLARKYQLVTNFGKFLDPLADKLLVTAALIGLVEIDLAPAWMVIVILSREFAVTGLRLIAAGTGAVIAADKLGKWKTTFQILAIAVLLLNNIIPIGTICLWIAVLLTVISGIGYFTKNKQVISFE
jgi:CDP-diacylglycerol--glycerol-3-phosphate 3-phosphatidyltransferase